MQDKQPLRSPEARLHAWRLADWGPTYETPEGRPHLKPQVGEHLELRLAAPATGPKPRTQVLHDSVPGLPARQRDSGQGRLDHLAARFPGTKPLDWLINGLIDCQDHTYNAYLTPAHRALQGLLAL